ERRVEQPFSSEQRVAKTADELDVVRHGIGHRDDAACVDAQLLTRGEIEIEHVAARVQKDEPLAGDLLQDEALAAEESRAELLREGDGEIDVADGAEERVALGKNGVAVQLERKD